MRTLQYINNLNQLIVGDGFIHPEKSIFRNFLRLLNTVCGKNKFLSRKFLSIYGYYAVRTHSCSKCTTNASTLIGNTCRMVALRIQLIFKHNNMFGANCSTKTTAFAQAFIKSYFCHDLYLLLLQPGLSYIKTDRLQIFYFII